MKILYAFAVLAILIAGCTNKSNKDNQSDAHLHDDIKLQITSYNDKYEVYAEADPFVVGSKSNILAHFSHIPEFTALEKGKITAKLIIGDKIFSQTLDEPTRKGIYSFNIKPSIKGKGLLIFEIGDEKSKLVVSKMQVFTDEHDAIHTADGQILGSTDGAVFTKEQSWKVDFATEKPQIKSIGTIINGIGEIIPEQTDEIILTAKANGIINFAENNLLLGVSVAKDQVLFSIVSDGFSENNATVRYIEAKNNFEKSKADYERLQKLADDKIISEKELLEAKNNYSNAKVKFENFSKDFNANGMIVKSDSKGFIRNIFVRNGTYVQAGQKIATIVKNQTLLLRTEVQQKYLPLLGSLYSANIKLLEQNKVYTLEELGGSIASVGKSVSSENFMIPVTLKFENNGKFLAGSIAEVYLKTEANNNALSIPNTALLEDQGLYFVYIQITPELFEKQEVKIGARDGVRTEILKGLNIDQRIVSIGATLVRLAHATGGLDAHSGHSH